MSRPVNREPHPVPERPTGMISLNSRHRRLAPLALAAVLVLGACGSDDSTADDSVPAVSDSSDSGGMMAPRPVRTSGAGGGTAMSASAEAAPASDRMATDMMAPYRIATFVAGEGLPALPTDDVGYLFEAGATVTAEQVGELAAALGVAGEPQQVDDGFSVFWRVGPDDGTAPSLFVSQDAQLNWNYSGAWANAQVMSGCAVAEPGVAIDPAVGTAGDDVAAPPPDTAIVDECVEPEPPANVPSAAEAEARARDLMVALGLDPETFTLEPYADEWSASVGAVEQIDGSFPGRRIDVTYGAEGALQYAGGQLAVPVAVGPYDLIDLDTALARLNDPTGFYTGYGSIGLERSMMDTAVASDVAVAPAAEPAVEPPVSDVAGGSTGSSGSSGSGTAPVDAMPVDPMPVDTVPAPEEVTVTLVDVVADVWWTWDVDGSVWLLPAYRFTGDDNGTYVVPAVTDEFLVQVPVEEVPMPETVPAPEPMPVETAPGQPPATTADFVTTDFDDLVGLPLDQFTEQAKGRGAETRVVLQDGESLAVTADFSPSRVNVEADTVDGVLTVVSVTSIG